MGEDQAAENEREHRRVGQCVCKAEAMGVGGVWGREAMGGVWGREAGENKVGWGSGDGER